MKYSVAQFICNKYILVAMLFIVCTSLQQSYFETDMIAEQLQNVAEFGIMERLDDEGLERIYGVDAKLVEDYCAYISPSRISAERLLVIRVGTKKNHQKVVQLLTEYGNKMAQGEYLPDVKQKVQRRVLCSRGDYIMFAIWEAGDPEEVFDDIVLKKKGVYNA